MAYYKSSLLLQFFAIREGVKNPSHGNFPLNGKCLATGFFDTFP